MHCLKIANVLNKDSMKNTFIALTLVYFTLATPVALRVTASAQAVKVNPDVYEWNPNPQIKKEYFAPGRSDQQPSTFAGLTMKAAPGTEHIFAYEIGDKDTRRPNDQTAWEEIPNFGKLKSTYTISGGASFESLNGGKKILPLGGQIDVQRIPLFVDSTWDGSPITITLNVVDEGTVVAATPANANDIFTPSGTDNPLSLTWTIIPSQNQIQALITLLPGENGIPEEGQIKAPGPLYLNSSSYLLKATPDIGAPGPSDYEGESVLEEFGEPVPLFTLEDLTNPQAYESVEQFAAENLSLGSVSTFVIDSNDTTLDTYSGFWTRGPNYSVFKPQSIRDGRIAYTRQQTYSSNGIAVKQVVVTFAIKSFEGEEGVLIYTGRSAD